MPEEMEGKPLGTGVSVNYLALENEAPDEFLAIEVSPEGQKVVRRDKDPAQLARWLRENRVNAVITTSGRGYETAIF